jgi:DNA adenine methylase
VTYLSPLRYPGGKARFARVLEKIIQANRLIGCEYFEPFAGGAGAGLLLLDKGVIERAHLNDLNPAIHAFWYSALWQTNRFVDKVQAIDLSIAEWKTQKRITGSDSDPKSFELGFATFYLNRCSHSGVLNSSGPIGGFKQTGQYKLGVRFNRTELSQRILTLSGFRDRIMLSCCDALAFLQTSVQNSRHAKFVYLDPPYVDESSRLYKFGFSLQQHREVASFLNEFDGLPWVLSYDNHPIVRELYAHCHIQSVDLQYSLQAKRTVNELVVTPKSVTADFRLGAEHSQQVGLFNPENSDDKAKH